MRNKWQLQEAKNQLSRVVENALNEGAVEVITRHGDTGCRGVFGWLNTTNFVLAENLLWTFSVPARFRISNQPPCEIRRVPSHYECAMTSP